MKNTINEWKCERDYEIVPMDAQESLLFLTCNHRVLRVSTDLGRRLQEGLSSMKDEEAEEWRLLEEMGGLAANNLEAIRSSGFQDGANLAINVNLTSFCNPRLHLLLR